jgi:hypothetical protein
MDWKGAQKDDLTAVPGNWQLRLPGLEDLWPIAMSICHGGFSKFLKGDKR